MARDLTVKGIEALLGAPPTKRRETPDGKVRGLYFVQQSSNTASWAFRFRHHGRSKKLTLGPWPGIDLSNARRLAGEAVTSVAKGEDPASAKKVEKAVARAAMRAVASDDADTVEKVIEHFIERHAKKKASRSWPEVKRTLDREAAGPWKGRPIATITKRDVLKVLDAIVDRGSHIMANRTLAHLRRFFNWAVERDIIAVSPCQGVKPPSEENSRDRVLNDEELRRVWLACDAIGWPFSPLFRLLILTGQRRDEVGAMTWSEIDFAAGSWILSKKRTKNAVEHVVPLSAPALAILAELPRIEGPSGFVFTTSGVTAVSGFSRAKDRLDAAIGEGGEPLLKWTLHDFRRSFARGCAGLGIALPVI